MSILIKGMEMPKRCLDCPCFDLEYAECQANVTATRENDCPLAEVPEPHGRLIDANELETKHHWTDDYYGTEYVEMEDIDNAPTVIEAEGE